jgi:hypothetical protein
MIKIENIQNLDEARYCAAVGFEMLSFSLQNATLTPPKIREIASWLTNVKFDLLATLAEENALRELALTFPFHSLTIEGNEWEMFQEKELLYDKPLIIKGENISFLEIEKLAAFSLAAKWQVKAENYAQIKDLQPYFEAIFVELPSIQAIIEWVDNQQPLPFGFTLNESARMIDGELDYDNLDLLAEKLGIFIC